MKKLSVLLLALLLTAAAQANGEMKGLDKHMHEHKDHHMHEHMKDHKGSKSVTGQPGAAAEALTKEKEEAGVTVKATYANPGEAIPVFNVALDTHTVDLEAYRFEDIIKLRDEGGREYAATVVSETGSGHHREAKVEFRSADIKKARHVELVVAEVGGVKERVFRFSLEGAPAVRL